MNSIIDLIVQTWVNSRKTKISGSKWITGNAPCCVHNGTTADTRKRGGLIRTHNSVNYHCFNCGYKATYVIGWRINKKMRNFLSWCGMPDHVINKISLQALKFEIDETLIQEVSLPSFPDRSLPEKTIPLLTAIEEYDQAVAVLEYIYDRGLTVDDYPWCWSPTMHDRLIIPFTYNYRIVGWTARKIKQGKVKYLSDQTGGYVFNLDEQKDSRQFIILTEGSFDAISINGIASLGAELSEKQILLINSINKPVIVVPDRDHAGVRLGEQALENKWYVSFPEWESHIKDVNDAVKNYGKLYTLYSIVKYQEHNPLKIKIKLKSWNKKNAN